MKHYLPFSLTLIRGAIGKEFVIKHYRYGIIKTKFPDMRRIIASLEQRKYRDLFRKAVAYAKEVIADEQRKRDWQKRLRRRNGVYNEAVKYFMLKDKRAKEAAMLEAKRLIRIAFSQKEKLCIQPRELTANPTCVVRLSAQENITHLHATGAFAFYSG